MKTYRAFVRKDEKLVSIYLTADNISEALKTVSAVKGVVKGVTDIITITEQDATIILSGEQNVEVTKIP